MAEKVARLIDTMNELLEKIVKENEKQKTILEQLDKVEQPYKLILEKVYIQGKTLVTTASEMDYDYKHMCKMNGIALKKFEQHDKRGANGNPCDKSICSPIVLSLSISINTSSLTPPLFNIVYAILIPTNPVPTKTTFPFFINIILSYGLF